MNGELPTQADKGIVSRIEEIQTRLETDQEFSRRTILKGLGAISALTALQGLAALERLDDKETIQTVAGDICPDLDVRCYLEQAELDVPPAMAPQGSVENVSMQLTAPVETTAPPPPPPPETTTSVPPPPPVAMVASQPAAMHIEMQPARAEQSPEPARRSMTYEQFIVHAEQYMSVLPRLEQMQALFPGTAFFHFIPEQLQHIADLKEAVQPSVDKYHAVAYDTTYSQTFKQTRPLNPRAFLWHWTGQHYETPDKLSGMKPNSVQLYVHHDAKPYQMVPQLDVVAGHARVMNECSWGMEMYSGTYDDVHSPLFSFTPAQVETGIYTAVRQLRSRNLPVSQFTILGHYAADLIFMNPYYDPATGAFREVDGHAPRVHKFDPPQEFIDMVVEKAVALDQALGPR